MNLKFICISMTCGSYNMFLLWYAYSEHSCLIIQPAFLTVNLMPIHVRTMLVVIVQQPFYP